MGIRTDIGDYGLADALPCPLEKTLALAQTKTRLKRLDAVVQERLINWGYAVCDAAMWRRVEPGLSAPVGFPYPNAGVGSKRVSAWCLCEDVSGGVPMSVDEFIRFLQIVAWPIVALVAIVVVRPHLAALMSKAKLKLSMFGQSIETTLPELQEVIQEQAEGTLTTEHVQYLDALHESGLREYPSGIESAERKFLRPLRNSGLIMAIPKGAFLTEAKAVQLSALGRLYVRARRSQK
jgi:hypothetical protein